MQIERAGLQLQVPDGWIDGSTITFTMPPAPLGGGLMVMKKQAQRPAASVSIAWQNAASSVTPSAYLDAHAGALAKELPRYLEVGRGPLEECPDAAFLEYGFDAGGLMLTQILLVRRVDTRLVCVTGTAIEAEYARQRARFVEAVCGIHSNA